MDLKGKKVLFLGDSITEGTGASSYENSYVAVFEKISGTHTENYGIGGTRIARQNVRSASERSDLDFVGRVDLMDGVADCVVVFGGTNDYGHGDAEIGEFSSRDCHTFYGAMHSLCLKLINKYPDSEIIFMTPLHRDDENTKLNRNGRPIETPLCEYVKIIKEVAAFYSLPVLDLYSMSGMQPEVPIIKQKYMPDGLHPSDKGAQRIAERLYAFLAAL